MKNTKQNGKLPEEKATTKHTYYSPGEKDALAVQVEFLLFKMGYKQKSISKILGISEQTICRWMVEYGWKEKKLILKRKRQQHPAKYDQSLSAFMAYSRIKHPDQYSAIMLAYNSFLKVP